MSLQLQASLISRQVKQGAGRPKIGAFVVKNDPISLSTKSHEAMMGFFNTVCTEILFVVKYVISVKFPIF
jgi:hypothetical protein